jgi:catechol 2,3-dioxygenase-like lactoylglutathione lyase family enzyme
MIVSKRMTAVSAAALILAVVPAAAQQPAAPTAPAQRPVVHMGSKSEEILIAKITVADLQKSHDFYTRIVGLKPVTSPDMQLPGLPAADAPEKDFIELPYNFSGSMADPFIAIMKRRGKIMPRGAASMIDLTIKVANVQAVMDRARAAGITPLRPFLNNGMPGFLSDPDGYTVELLQAPSF